MRLQRTINRKKNKVRLVVVVLCLAVFGYSAYRVGINYYRAQQSQKAAEEEARKVQEQLEDARRRAEEEARKAEEERKAQEAANQQSGEETNQEPEPEPFVLNFDELSAINSDIMGWISVDGTNINYPLLYSYTDRNFYLYHNYRAEYDSQGSIYIENFNRRDLSDFNTVVYGHSMLNGNMFGTLHNFSNWDFFYSHGNITLYTPTNTYTYEVFETATIDDTHIFTYLDNSSKDSINKYIETLAGYNSGLKKDGYTITPEDHILTLSTCTTDDTKRLVVFAVLTNVT